MAFLNTDELALFEDQYSSRVLNANKIGSTPAYIGQYPVCDYAVRRDNRKLSFIPTISEVPTLIELVPQVLMWRESHSFLDLVNALYLQLAEIRLHQAFDDIEKWDSELSLAMRESVETLPAWAAVRFKIAPETQRRISLLMNDPATHIAFLCRALKAERMVSGEAVTGEGCWTALGDFYVTCGNASEVVDPRLTNWSPNASLRAPRIQQVIPVDSISPNSRDISAPQLPVELYTPAETAEAWRVLDDAFARITSVNAAAGQLIKRFVSVIIALKTNSSEPGSSSAYSCPGRVVLRNSHLSHVATMVSALIHEAIHQVLYIVEGFGRFVDDTARITRQIVVPSPWTNRKLPLHSYLHACFVWYGLAKFWRQAITSNLFSAKSVQEELSQALLGFRSTNPVDRLLPYRTEIRCEALRSAASLWDDLRNAGDLDLCAGTNNPRSSESHASSGKRCSCCRPKVLPATFVWQRKPFVDFGKLVFGDL